MYRRKSPSVRAHALSILRPIKVVFRQFCCPCASLIFTGRDARATGTHLHTHSQRTCAHTHTYTRSTHVHKRTHCGNIAQYALRSDFMCACARVQMQITARGQQQEHHLHTQSNPCVGASQPRDGQAGARRRQKDCVRNNTHNEHASQIMAVYAAHLYRAPPPHNLMHKAMMICTARSHSIPPHSAFNI